MTGQSGGFTPSANPCAICVGYAAQVAEAQTAVRQVCRRLEAGEHTHSGRTARGELPHAKERLATARRFQAEHTAAHDLADAAPADQPVIPAGFDGVVTPAGLFLRSDR